eukprot:COSAG01_NODE_2415_length_7736_cov_42.301034_3_plen_49_part_00
MQYCLALGHVFSPENIPVKPPYSHTAIGILAAVAVATVAAAIQSYWLL